MSYYITWGLLHNVLRQHGASTLKGQNIQWILDDENIMLSQNDTNHSATQFHIQGEWTFSLHCCDNKKYYFCVRTAVVNTFFNKYGHTADFGLSQQFCWIWKIFWVITLCCWVSITYPVKNCIIPEVLNFQIDAVFILITLCKCPEFDSMPYN